MMVKPVCDSPTHRTLQPHAQAEDQRTAEARRSADVACRHAATLQSQLRSCREELAAAHAAAAAADMEAAEAAEQLRQQQRERCAALEAQLQEAQSQVGLHVACSCQTLVHGRPSDI